jgi:nucleoside-diphosphate-sugar epimerase
MPSPRIVVFGGSGFLGIFSVCCTNEGSHICRAATRKEWSVTSISRSGGRSTQKGRISYEKVDIFTPEKYREFLKDVKAVVYSAGMLLEGDYKSLAQGKWDVSKFLGLLRSANPLQADPENPSRYDRVNRDGGLPVGDEADGSNSGSTRSCRRRRAIIHFYLSSCKLSRSSFTLYHF